MHVNVLITSAGRRVRLVEIFRDTLKEFGDGKVFACDLEPGLSAACYRADECFKAPPVKSKEYVGFLLELCKTKSIGLVVPTIDTELSILAAAKKEFEKAGIFVAVSSETFCKQSALKTTTYDLFRKAGVKTPKIITNLQTASYPLFAKLNNSSLSKGAQVVTSYEEALLLQQKDKDYIFQEFVEGQEYTVDCFIDRTGKLISVVPRKRIEVRGGEVSKAQSVKDRSIIVAIKELVTKFSGAYGVLTIQLFKNENEITFIEINPRFGGGYPLSFMSGANFAKFLILDMQQQTLTYDESWQERLMLRYDAEVIVDV